MSREGKTCEVAKECYAAVVTLFRMTLDPKDRPVPNHTSKSTTVVGGADDVTRAIGLSAERVKKVELLGL